MCKVTNNTGFRDLWVDLFYYFGEGFTNKVNDSVTTTNKGQPVLAVLKSVNDADKSDLDKYTALIRAQLVQFKQNKTNSMIYLGARDISDIEYNEDGIKLVNQQNNSAE